MRSSSSPLHDNVLYSSCTDCEVFISCTVSFTIKKVMDQMVDLMASRQLEAVQNWSTIDATVDTVWCVHSNINKTSVCFTICAQQRYFSPERKYEAEGLGFHAQGTLSQTYSASEESMKG